MMNFKNIAKTITITFLCLCASTAVMAAEFGDIRYPDRPLNLRTARTPKSKWVGTLQVGQKVRVAYLKDGWVAVFEPYMTSESSVRIAGYANEKYLKKRQGKSKVEPWGELMHPVTVLNIRADRSPSSRKVGVLTPRSNVLVDFPEDGWYAVFEDKATIRSKLNAVGYVKNDYLEPAPARSASEQPAAEPVVESEPVKTPARSGAGEVRSSVAPVPAADDEQMAEPAVEEAEEAAPESEEAVAPWGEVVTIEQKVMVRQERSSKSNYVRTLNPGDRVKLDLLRNGWYAVFDADEAVRGEHKALGYVFKRELDPDSQPEQKPAATQQGLTAKKAETPKKIVIKPDPFASARKPDPKADQNRHGIRFKVLEKSETSRQGDDIIRLVLFVDVDKLPKAEVLEDFANTLWKEHRRNGKFVELSIYLPGMDLDDLAFVVARYSAKERLEFWARRTALYGTKYMK